MIARGDQGGSYLGDQGSLIKDLTWVIKDQPLEIFPIKGEKKSTWSHIVIVEISMKI